MQTIEVGLAVPSHDPERMRPLLALKMGDVDAGFGIDRLRLEAHVTEPVYATQHAGHAHALAAAERRQQDDMALPDLIGRLGARIGLDHGAGVLALAVTEANAGARAMYEGAGMREAARYHYRIARG